jgi:hypothetical protein
MKVAHFNGEHEVNIGDRFTFATGDSWEIVRLERGTSYSPAGIGGTPAFACKPLGPIPGYCSKYVNKDGTVTFCGDSIAGTMALAAEQGPTSPAQEQER